MDSRRRAPLRRESRNRKGSAPRLRGRSAAFSKSPALPNPEEVNCSSFSRRNRRRGGTQAAFLLMQNTSSLNRNQHSAGDPPRFCAIVGPTASGKTALSLALAEKLGCGILCVDAMQVYRGLDIGTAKPSREEQRRVAHQGLDLASPLEYFSASRFAAHAGPLLAEAGRESRPWVLCGGTGLYFRALLEGLFEAPDADPALREALLERARRDGPAVLYTELEKRDPETAARIHPQDARRITRALEIIEQTGMPVSELRRRQVRKPWIRQTLFLGLQRDRRDLLHRIEKRSRWMYDNGLIEETRWLVDLGCGPQHTALQALGYKECREYVLGRKSRDEALEETIRETGRYARRQMNWFRNQFETRWIDVDSCNNLYETVNVSLQLWRKSGNNIASRS